jgi:hypothetical protein
MCRPLFASGPNSAQPAQSSSDAAEPVSLGAEHLEDTLKGMPELLHPLLLQRQSCVVEVDAEDRAALDASGLLA